MKKALLSILRDKNTSRLHFRQAADQLASLIGAEAALDLQEKEYSLETPLGKARGYRIEENIILVPVLRSGLVLLHGFLKYFSDAKIGILGLKRDEKTAKANLYYKNIPDLKKTDHIFLLDPMIATGGTIKDSIKILKKEKIQEKNIHIFGIIASEEGIRSIKKEYPHVKIDVVGLDPKLNQAKYIVPGLGDFGDRYFGTI
jgi:uracil phosphoribosyltransferase